MLYDEGFAFEPVENTLVTVWTGDPVPTRLTHMVQQLSTLYARHPQGVYLFAVVRPTAGTPKLDARLLMQRQFQQMRNRLLAAAIVLEKTGVAGALSRTMLSTLSTLARQPFPLKTFGDRGSGAQWLAERSTLARASVIIALAAKLEQSLAQRPHRSVRPPAS